MAQWLPANSPAYDTPQELYASMPPGPFAPYPAAAHEQMGHRAYSRYPAAAHNVGLMPPSYTSLMLGGALPKLAKDSAISPVWAIMQARGVLDGLGTASGPEALGVLAGKGVLALALFALGGVASYYAGRAMAPSRSDRASYGWYGLGVGLVGSLAEGAVGGPVALVGLGALGAYASWKKG